MNTKTYPKALIDGLMSSRQLFAQINQAYWSKFEDHIPAGQDKYVLVDFLVTHPGYMMGNAIIAKYLQYVHGYKPLVLLPDRKFHWVADIAKSYGFEEFVHENDSQTISVSAFDSLPYNNATSPEALRSMVLGTKLNEIPVGDLIYDSYLSGESSGTISEIDHKLKQASLGSLYYYSLGNKLFQEYDFGAVIMGHRVYNRFGVITRMAIDKGIPVYGRKQRSFPAFTVRRDDSIESAMNFEYHFEDSEFNRALERITPEMLAEAKHGVLHGFNGGLTHEAHNDNRKTLSHEELCRDLNLDPNKPIVSIFSHCLTDSPHFCGGNIFDDYLQWLLATLAIAKENTNVNWILKAHPNQSRYQCSQSAQSVFHEYAAGHPHLVLAPDDYHIHTFYNNSNAAVTCSGSAGLEFPCLGIPAITAADGWYGGKGFTIQAKDQADYQQKLLNIEDHFSFSAEQQRRALTYWHLGYIASRVESHFVPTFGCQAPEPQDEISIWFESAHLLKGKTPFDDPFYHAFKFQVENQTRHPFPHDFWTPHKKGEAA